MYKFTLFMYVCMYVCKNMVYISIHICTNTRIQIKKTKDAKHSEDRGEETLSLVCGGASPAVAAFIGRGAGEETRRPQKDF